MIEMMVKATKIYLFLAAESEKKWISLKGSSTNLIGIHGGTLSDEVISEFELSYLSLKQFQLRNWNFTKTISHWQQLEY